MKNKFNLTISVTILSILFIGCVSIKPQYYKDDLKLAEIELEKIIDNYNEKNAEKLYENSHINLKNNQSKPNFVEAVKELHTLFGHVNGKELKYSKVKLFSVKERIVHLIYKTKFEKSEKMLQIAIITNDKNAKLLVFNVDDLEKIAEIKHTIENQK